MEQALTAKRLKYLMRTHHVSIVELSKRMSIAMKKIRLRRSTGIDAANIARDWVQAITGDDPGNKTRY